MANIHIFWAASFLLICLFSIAQLQSSQQIDEESFLFIRSDDPSNDTKESRKCQHLGACLNHMDCGGTDGKPGKPRCIGALIGKCDCGACIAGLRCANDTQCGGLQNGCDKKTGFCNCYTAAQVLYAQNPNKKKYPTLMSSITDLCNHENCLTSAVGCYGLPCKKGVCICV